MTIGRGHGSSRSRRAARSAQSVWSRRHLIEAALVQPARCLVQAPFGFGKTHHVREIARGRDDAVWADGVSAVAAVANESDSSWLVIVDQLDRWDDADVRELCGLFATGRCPPILIATRHCPSVLADHLLASGTVVVGANDLRISDAELEAELAAMDLSETTTRESVTLVDGWPLLAARAIEHLTACGGRDSTFLSLHHPVVSTCIRDVLGQLGRQDVQTLGQLAHLDAMSPPVVDALSPGLSDRMALGGIPTTRLPDGRDRLMRPVKRWLELHHRLRGDAVDALVPALIDNGEHLGAVRLLIRGGRVDEAAKVCVEMPHDVHDALDPVELAETVELLEPAMESYPRLMLILADAYWARAESHRERYWLERAIQVTGGADSDDVRREASVEHLRLRVLSGEQSGELDEAIEHEAEQTGNLATSARLMECRALRLSFKNEPMLLPQALDLNRRATASFEALGEHQRAASAYQWRAISILIPLGRFADAEAAVQRALALSAGTALDRLRALRVVCIVIAITGDDRRTSELAETSTLARRLGLEWVEAAVHGARMQLAGVHGSIDEVNHHFEKAWQLFGELRTHPTGAILTANASEAAACAGDVGRARSLLESIRDRRDECTWEWLFAELAIHGREGDLAALERTAKDLERLYGDIDGEKFRIDLYRALAHRTIGDPRWERSRQRAIAALHKAGAPRLGVLLDDDHHRRAEPPVHVVTEPAHVADGVSIQALGGFAVRRDGKPVALPGSRIAGLVKTLAIADGRVPIDIVLDRLWPDAPVEVSRRRLKNVIFRARSLLGDVIIRHPERVELAPNVHVDVIEFSTAARLASQLLANGAADGVSAGLQALANFGGLLLPDDLYDDAIAPVRVALSARALSLVNSIIANAESELLAPILLEHVLRIDPADVATLTNLARWSDAIGHRAVAQLAARQAVGALVEAGDTPADDIDRLARQSS